MMVHIQLCRCQFVIPELLFLVVHLISQSNEQNNTHSHDGTYTISCRGQYVNPGTTSSCCTSQ